MIRRVILVISTIAAVTAAVWVYYVVAGRDELGTGPVNMQKRGPVSVGPTTGEGASLDVIHELRITARDDDGRREGLYLAKRYTRRDDGSHLLTDAKVTLYQRNGQQMILMADQAEVYGEQVEGGVNVRRAVLTGNVTIYFDPETRLERPPVEQRLDDVVRIYVDDVEFDNEHLTVRTDGPVKLYSPEADVFGQGLSISWNESPRELRILRIERGEYMTVKDVPEELDVVSLPGATSRPATQPASRPTSRPDGAATRPTAIAAAPTTRPGGAGTATAPSGGPRFGLAETRPTSKPTPTSAPARPEVQNRYLAQFNGDVKVVQRSRKLYGAETLSLRFDWDPKWRDESQTMVGRSRRRRRREAASRPATAPATQPTTAATTGPAEDPNTMRIYWTGPLVIRPTGHTPDPKRDHYRVTATGEKLLLTDPRATAACGQFVFDYPQREGKLTGRSGRPVRLVLAEGAEVTCPTVRFNPNAGLAVLEGAGRMARRYEEELTQEQCIRLAESAATQPAAEWVAWSDRVDIAFTEERKERPDGRADTRQFVDRADFHGGVILRQSDEPDGDEVRCDRLEVRMKRGQVVSVLPREAVATGHVSARQEGADVTADKVTVTFREALPGAEADGNSQIAPGIEPAGVVAEGNVRLADRRDPNSPPLTAECDRVESDLVHRVAVLTGKPARVEQGPNRLRGARIRVEQAEQAAAVDGNGVLEFLTDRDLNGARLSEPRPVKVAWTDGMEFFGHRNTAAFRGGVSLDSGMDHMGCDRMELIFSEPVVKAKPAATQPATRPTTRPATRPATQPATKPATQPAAGSADPPSGKPRSRKRPGRGRLAVGVERYSSRRISMILADQNVLLRSRRENGKEQILLRVQLSGKKLIYDADLARMTMLGHGTFVAEDYQKPKERRPTAADGSVEALDRPSQSAFQWHGSMQLSQKDRLAVLDGEVTLVHRSGQQVILTDRLPVPREQWTPLPAGRKTILKCDNLLAKFGPPKEKAAGPATTRPTADLLEGGPDLGPLDLFIATKDVNLKDGPRQVLAQRLVYDRSSDRAVIWGFLEGKPPADATVYYEDPATGRSQGLNSPKFIWYRHNNKIVTGRLTGTGAR